MYGNLNLEIVQNHLLNIANILHHLRQGNPWITPMPKLIDS